MVEVVNLPDGSDLYVDEKGLLKPQEHLAVPKMTNEELERALFAIYQDKRLNNYSIVEEDQNQDWPYRVDADDLLSSL